jgi:hypothetical protein
LTCTPDELESAFKAWKASLGGDWPVIQVRMERHQ